MASEVLSKSLSLAMNNSITSSTFADRAKVVTVVRNDKKTDNKFIKLLFKNMRELQHSMSNYISPYVSAYRKGSNFQHVLIRLSEEWRQHLDNNKVVGGVFMDLSKAFDCVPHDLLTAKLAAHSVDKNLLMYTYIFLSFKQKAVRSHK